MDGPPALNSQLSTGNSKGTVLVLTVALLAMLALVATTFLVTARYDQVSVQGAMVSHQMEILLSMLESDIRRKLAEDLWGGNAAHDGPGDSAHEGYDGPDAAHGWLRGTCGNLVEWEPTSGAPSYVQAVVTGDGSWRWLAGTQVDGLTFRYAVLIQDLGGLVNVNVARQPDPDMVGEAYPVSPSVGSLEDWPYTIWAFHAANGNPAWGYWWYPYKTRTGSSGTWTVYSGMGKHMRGGGPAQQADLRYLLADRGELGPVDRYFRTPANYGRQFDIQDEMDLRCPGLAYGGAPYPSLLEVALPSLFSSSTHGGIPAHRRRLVTAVGRVAGWQARREPVRMHPYDDAFWAACGLAGGKGLCDESFFFRVDCPNFDDLVKHFRESRMGYRIPAVMGVAFCGMAEDNPYDIYTRLTAGSGANNVPNRQSPVLEFPSTQSRYADGNSFYGAEWKDGDEYRRNFPPYQYTDYIVDYDKRNHTNNVYTYGHSPTMITLLLSNTMAVMGVPKPDVLDPAHPDDVNDCAPAGGADVPAEKEARVKAYRELAGTFHLNMIDYQDPNTLPGLLHSHTTRRTFSQYGDRAGAEDRPYLTEAVIEFEPWPDYCMIWEGNRYYIDRVSGTGLWVVRVDKNTSADTQGLQYCDQITGVRNGATPTAAFTAVSTLAALRTFLKTVATPGSKVDLQLTRSGAARTVSGVAIRPAVQTIAIEVYNPHDHAIQMTDAEMYGRGRCRHNVGAPQQYDDTAGARAILSDYYNKSQSTYCPALPARTCMLYVERRGITDGTGMRTWMDANGLGHASYYYPTCQMYTSVCPTNRGGFGNLVNLRGSDGEIVLHLSSAFGDGWRFAAWLSDAIRNAPSEAAAPPMPASSATPGAPAGIAAAFSAAESRMGATTPYPVVRLYRPMYMESRATQFLTAWNSWTETDIAGKTPTSRLGRREESGDYAEDDFTVTYSSDYKNIDARGLLITTTNQGFRFGADVSRVTRLTHPRMKNTAGDVSSGRESSYYYYTHIEYDSEEGDVGKATPTEVVDRHMRHILGKINGLSGAKTLAGTEVRRLLQKAEARLRFSPYTAATEAERAECRAYYDFVDAFTCGGSLYDNVDNNGDGVADERIPHGFGGYHNDVMPDGLPETHPVRINVPGSSDEASWLKEASNVWPAYGRINVNTAPREILEHCIMAPSDTVRQDLGAAIYAERGGEASQSNGSYKPFKNLAELYGRVSVMNGHAGGFDRYGFDGADNHNGAARLPDMAPDPYGYIDDLDERNYLWRINSEILTLCSDTFAAYLRVQGCRNAGGTQKIIAERRVYEIWDRAQCTWPPLRHDGRPHPDFAPPQRVGIQLFSF